MVGTPESSHGYHVTHQVQLAENDPFDWESYIAPYKGLLLRMHKLIYLATCCPQLRQVCASAALDLIKETTRDTSTYQHVLTIHNTTPTGSLIPSSDRKPIDSEWISQTDSLNHTEREKLELEMRNYQNNLIKESIRMAHRDLGDHLKSTGELQEALKAYTRTRDYCSTSQHVVEMCLNVIDVSLMLENYSNVQTFVSKAEGVLESYIPNAREARSTGAVVPPTKGSMTPGSDAIGALFRAGGSSAASSLTNTAQAAFNPSETAAKRQVAEIGNKLRAAHGLACLGLGRYEAAARTLVSLDPTYSSTLFEYLSPSDVAIYVVLCALATMERVPLKSQVLDQANFGQFLEHEPHARELIEAFSSAEFKKVGSVLSTWSSRHMLDPNLAPHMESLTTSLHRRALRQFFTPFDRISIPRMSSAFGWEEDRMSQELIACVERGEFIDLAGIKGEARIDWQEKTIEYKQTDTRQSLFEQALKNGEKWERENRRLLLRIKLVQNGLVVKAQNQAEVEAQGL